MDGVPGVTQYPIPPGGNFTYRFSTRGEYGFYWYHSHFRAYYDDAIRGPLLIHPASSRPRPFDSLAANPDAMKTMLQVERDAASVLLTDWTHATSDTIYSQYFETGAFPNCVDSVLANGYGRVEVDEFSKYLHGHEHVWNVKEGRLNVDVNVYANIHDNGDSNRKLNANESINDGVDEQYGEFYAHANIFEPSWLCSAHDVQDRLQYLLPATGELLEYNGAIVHHTSEQYRRMAGLESGQRWICCEAGCVPRRSLDVRIYRGWTLCYFTGGQGKYTSFIALQYAHILIMAQVLYISLGQRYSVMIRLNQKPGHYYLRFATYPTGDMQQVLEGQAVVSYKSNNSKGPVVQEASQTWMLVNGSAKQDVSTIDPASLSPFTSDPPPSGAAAVAKMFSISQTGITTWVLDQSPYAEASRPILYGNASDGWNANTTIHLPYNATVDLIMMVANDSMDQMGHPMHLHGHKFWVLGSGSDYFPYSSVVDAPTSMINLHNPPYRDTTDLPPSGWVAIRYDTDNPNSTCPQDLTDILAPDIIQTIPELGSSTVTYSGILR
ncbi:hypothetical protein MMC30_003827 [Trapelia coarctata]|nr:hypothetical protein [Trapelia coarctata]